MSWLPWLGLAVTLGLLLVSERWIHRHLQGAMLLLVGDREIAVVLYALPLMPGIVLHEVSHALTARLLGVRAGRVSIGPRLADGRIQLGFVPVEETDFVRASLIGLAPLLTGTAVILLIGYSVFDIGMMQQDFVNGNWAKAAKGLAETVKAPDVWLWLYLIFAVSNTMLPSESDREASMPILLFLGLVLVLAWVAGLGTKIVDYLGQSLDLAALWLTAMYVFTIAADLPFVLLIALLERVLGRLKGVRVEY
jgi:hypothetical protein